jgi:hypothetical protein
MHRPLRTLQLLAATAALALAGFAYLRHRQIRTQLEQPFGHYTRQQMLERTLPLCRIVQPEPESLSLSTETLLVPDRWGRLCRLWSVDYKDQLGKYLAEFTWDADTGELLRVSHWLTEVAARPSGFASPKPFPSRQQARVRAAFLSYRWLQRLGFAQAGSRWRLTKPPEPSPTPECSVWNSLWRCGERVVFVKVDVVSGELVCAQRSYASALPPVRQRSGMAR